MPESPKDNIFVKHKNDSFLLISDPPSYRLFNRVAHAYATARTEFLNIGINS
jgi:hypothetical protein